MNPRWQKIEEAVALASEIEAGKRADWLAEFCGGDAELQTEIESLLAVETEADRFLENAAGERFAALMPDAETSFAGERFGNYRIVREIGRGGMGAVFLAERSDGEFNQQVALKIVRQTFLDRELENHFRRERQILASLNHPNIARLLDGGVSDAGEPFLVMEFIAGETLLEYAARENLSTEECLKLFTKICAAVAFAHRNLIVHRDIKPSNILVTKDGEPKLLDFGLAKILSFETDAAQTATAFRALTPAYASPEQMRGDAAVTTASDIYSLGVVLYELLTGMRPFNFKTNSFEEMIRLVSTQEPVRPSLTNSKPQDESTENRKSQIANRKSLKGDVDNIVLMSLRKEPERRYKSVEAFADDIKRFLDGLPIAARPNTFAYRAEKFVRRNAFGAAAGALIFVALIGGVAATLWQARRAETQRARAEKRFNDVRRLANSFLFEIHPQIENLPGAMTARETLVKRALEYLDSLAQESSDDRELQRELAAAYEKVGDVQGRPNQPNLGDIKGALDSYEKAQTLRLAVLGANRNEPQATNELAANYEQVANMLWWTSDTKGAEELYEKSLAMRETLVAENQQANEFRWALGKLQMQYGDVPAWNKETDKALNLYRAALDNLQKSFSRDNENLALKGDVARCQTRLADALKANGDFAEAVRQTNEAVTIYENLIAAQPDDLKHRRGLWVAYLRQCEVYLLEKNAANSLASCAKMPPVAERSLAAEPKNFTSRQDLAASYNLYGEALTLNKHYADALENFNKSLAIVQKVAEDFADKSEYQRDAALNHISIGKVFFEQKKFDAALESDRRAETLLEEILNDDAENPEPLLNLANAHKQIGEIYFERKNFNEARNSFSRALEILRKLDGENALAASDKNLLTELNAKLSK